MTLAYAGQAKAVEAALQEALVAWNCPAWRYADSLFAGGHRGVLALRVGAGCGNCAHPPVGITARGRAREVAGAGAGGAAGGVWELEY